MSRSQDISSSENFINRGGKLVNMTTNYNTRQSIPLRHLQCQHTGELQIGSQLQPLTLPAVSMTQVTLTGGANNLHATQHNILSGAFILQQLNPLCVRWRDDFQLLRSAIDRAFWEHRDDKRQSG